MRPIKRRKLDSSITAPLKPLDPHRFYEYRVTHAMLNAKGLELFVHRLMGPDVMRSIALAIDPLSRFRSIDGRIAEASRKRERAIDSILGNRTVTYKSRAQTRYTTFQSQPFMVAPTLLETPPSITESSYATKRQLPLPDVSLDTISSTRKPGTDLGELELSQCSLRSSPRSWSATDRSDSYTDYGSLGIGKSLYSSSSSYTVAPSAAVFPRDSYDTLRIGELNLAHRLLERHVLKMYGDSSPYARETTLLRNIIELRDLPRSISSLQKTFRDTIQLGRNLKNPDLDKIARSFKQVPKNISGEYLSYIFGWRQLYKDTLELMQAPDKIAKRLNFLIARSGRVSTFRRTYSPQVEASDVTSGFEYDWHWSEANVKVAHSMSRTTKLDLVFKAGFEFPDVMLPNFQKDLFLQKMGLVPRLSDLYNLTPWTWLYDWFTGLGDYITNVENINKDPRLIQWGLISCRLNTDIISTFSSQTQSFTSIVTNPPYQSDYKQTLSPNNHNSVLELRTHVRKDVGKLIGVRSIVVPESLTQYQQSVLSALISQRTKTR